MDFIFEALNTIRQNTWKAIEHLSEEQLHKIPEGCSNNISWNLGHMVVSQQILCYKLGNTPLLVPDTALALYRKGSSPKEWSTPADLKQIKAWFEITSASFEPDYKAKKFDTFTEYPTSSGLVLRNIDQALLYNYGHENLHYGVILALRKLV